MEDDTTSNMKIGDLPNEMVLKILCYVPLEGIFSTLQYLNRRFHSLCKDYTLPKEIDTHRYQFLHTEELVQLIKNSTGLKSFHYNGSGKYVTANSTIFEHLGQYAKSLEKLAISHCIICDEDLLFSLIGSSSNLTELRLFGVTSLLPFKPTDEYDDLPTMPSLKKLFISSFEQLKFDDIMRIVNACPNLTHVAHWENYIRSVKETNTRIIKERGSNLKYLCYDVFQNNESFQNVSNCPHLETLHLIRLQIRDNSGFKLPLMSNISNLTLDWMSHSDDQYVKILESFPNLMELTLQRTTGMEEKTSKCIAKMEKLTKLGFIVEKNYKNNVLFIFKNSESIKYARIHLNIIKEMTEEEVIDCFSECDTLEVMQLTKKYIPAAGRLVHWLPKTKIYLGHYNISDISADEKTRIWPTDCKFSVKKSLDYR